jgi:hypothetical protein
MASTNDDNNNNHNQNDNNDNSESVQYPPKVPFNQYQFEQDPRWSKFVRSIETPSAELSEQEIQYRIKRKFYRQFVDSDPSSSTATPPPSSFEQQPTTNPTTNSNRTTNSTPNTTSATGGGGGGGGNPTAPTSNSLFDFSIGRIPEKIWLLASISILFHGVLCLVPFFFSAETNATIFHRFLFSAIASYGVSLLQTHGTPQFNMVFFQRFMMDNNAQFLLVCLMLLSNLPNPCT